MSPYSVRSHGELMRKLTYGFNEFLHVIDSGEKH